MNNIQYSLKSHMKIIHLFEYFLCSSKKKPLVHVVLIVAFLGDGGDGKTRHRGGKAILYQQFKDFFLKKNMQNEKCAKVRLEEERGIRRTVEEKLR